MAKVANIMGVSPDDIANVMGVTSLANTEILGLKIIEPIWSGERMVMANGSGENNIQESAYKSFASDSNAADWIDAYHIRTDSAGTCGNGVHMITGAGRATTNSVTHADSVALEVYTFANTSGTAALTGGAIANQYGLYHPMGCSNGTLGFIWGGHMGGVGNSSYAEYFTIATNADCTSGPSLQGYAGSDHGCSNGDTYALIAMGGGAEGRVMRHNFSTTTAAEIDTASTNGHIWGLPDPDGIGPEGTGYGPRSHVKIWGPSACEGDSSRVIMWGQNCQGPYWAYANYAAYWPQAMIYYMNPNSQGEASDFGDMDEPRAYSASSSNKIRGELWGGAAQNTFSDQTRSSTPNSTENSMEKITIASTSNGNDYADLPFSGGNSSRNQTSSGN